MKKRRMGILLSLALVFICAYALSDAAIDETNFPDGNFRSCVAGFDTDGDGILSDRELTSVTEIHCAGGSIPDMTGIGHFTALTILQCADNYLTALDVSRNTALKSLRCCGNHLTVLDVSENTQLTWLRCEENNLQELNIIRVPALAGLAEETKPTETGGGLTWQEDAEGDGWADLYLTVDKGVDLIT